MAVVSGREYTLPIVSSNIYLRIESSNKGALDIHIRKLLENGMKNANQLYKVIISNKNINLTMYNLILLSVIRPNIEYGSEL